MNNYQKIYQFSMMTENNWQKVLNLMVVSTAGTTNLWASKV